MTPWLQGELTTLAFCWRLDRRDGVTLGFTSHDRDMIIDGLPYRAAPGMLPSAISVSDGFDVDTLDITGALSDASIRDVDLAAGRWDGAALRLFATDWADPARRVLPLTRGELGDVEIRDSRFTAELRGPTALLERPAVELTSPECRAELGDRRCRVDMAGRRHMARIVTFSGPSDITIDTAGEGDYAYGRLRWIDGPNSGLTSAIRSGAGVVIQLREPPPFAAHNGDYIEISEGCDKAFETCRDRFANSINFRGEPHLAGNDLLTRYPGA